MARRRRRDPRTIALYSISMLREFRGTLLALACMVLFGAVLFRITVINGAHPPLMVSFYASWMLMLAQSVLPQETWYLELLGGTVHVTHKQSD